MASLLTYCAILTIAVSTVVSDLNSSATTVTSYTNVRVTNISSVVVTTSPGSSTRKNTSVNVTNYATSPYPSASSSSPSPSIVTTRSPTTPSFTDAPSSIALNSTSSLSKRPPNTNVNSATNTISISSTESLSSTDKIIIAVVVSVGAVIICIVVLVIIVVVKHRKYTRKGDLVAPPRLRLPTIGQVDFSTMDAKKPRRPGAVPNFYEGVAPHLPGSPDSEKKCTDEDDDDDPYINVTEMTMMPPMRRNPHTSHVRDTTSRGQRTRSIMPPPIDQEGSASSPGFHNTVAYPEAGGIYGNASDFPEVQGFNGNSPIPEAGGIYGNASDFPEVQGFTGSSSIPEAGGIYGNASDFPSKHEMESEYGNILDYIENRERLQSVRRNDNDDSDNR